MDNKIPDFLIEMSKQMNTQDNRSTAHPFFQVRCKRYMVTEEGYNDHHWELHAEDSDGYPAFSTKEDYDNVAAVSDFEEKNKEWCKNWCKYWLREHIDEECIGDDSGFTDSFDFEDHENKGLDWPEGYRVVHMQEYEDVISTHLTEADAEWFIRRKQHDYPKLYTYAESAYWSPQVRLLQDWIKSLTGDANG